jgi:1,4-dihydroxy-2-naphthoyl-CoA synthase
MNEAGLASMTRHIYDMLLQSEDAKEGPNAFAEKRQPQWKGR